MDENDKQFIIDKLINLVNKITVNRNYYIELCCSGSKNKETLTFPKTSINEKCCEYLMNLKLLVFNDYLDCSDYIHGFMYFFDISSDCLKLVQNCYNKIFVKV